LPIAVGRLELLGLLREMIVTGAWWDHVDAVAHGIAALLVAHRDHMTPLVLGWAREQDCWLRRSSIICQLGLRARTDTALLSEVIMVNAADPEFALYGGCHPRHPRHPCGETLRVGAHADYVVCDLRLAKQ